MPSSLTPFVHIARSHIPASDTSELAVVIIFQLPFESGDLHGMFIKQPPKSMSGSLGLFMHIARILIRASDTSELAVVIFHLTLASVDSHFVVDASRVK